MQRQTVKDGKAVVLFLSSPIDLPPVTVSESVFTLMFSQFKTAVVRSGRLFQF